MYIGTTLPIKQITAERIISLYQEADKNINHIAHKRKENIV